MIDTDVQTMFRIPYFIAKVEPWDTIKEQIISAINSAPDYCVDPSGFETDFQHVSYPTVQRKDWSSEEVVTNYVKLQKLNNYSAQVYGILKPYVAEITERYFMKPPPEEPPLMWSQKYNRKSEHPAHNHGNRGFSFILYLKFDPMKHKSTRFYCPFSDFFTGEMITFAPEVEEGDLIAFPSPILHSSDLHTADTERMILAFNLYPHGF